MKFTIKIHLYIQTRYKMTWDTAASERRQSISMYTIITIKEKLIVAKLLI